MPKFYEMADAFLVTLKANKNISYTLPNKVQSYMAAGKPIIGAIDGETKLVIEEASCGYCSPAEDFQALASNIRAFLNETDKHEEYGKQARSYYDSQFSKHHFMKRLTVLLQNTI
jgi:glycosyltransferase involved in cell wall biosynthesis